MSWDTLVVSVPRSARDLLTIQQGNRILRIPLLIMSSLVIISLTANSTLAQNEHKRLFIEAADGFEIFVAAAMVKKQVGIDVVTDIEKADYVMKASGIEVKKVGSGAKWANCLFAYCAGNEDKGSTSVQVVDREGIVRWSYAVNKGRGQKNQQALAEAIAKHFKSEMLRQR
jgi:hypothetical protein